MFIPKKYVYTLSCLKYTQLFVKTYLSFIYKLQIIGFLWQPFLSLPGIILFIYNNNSYTIIIKIRTSLKVSLERVAYYVYWVRLLMAYTLVSIYTLIDSYWGKAIICVHAIIHLLWLFIVLIRDLYSIHQYEAIACEHYCQRKRTLFERIKIQTCQWEQEMTAASSGVL